VRVPGDRSLAQEKPFTAPAQAEGTLELPLAERPVGLYEADLSLKCGADARTFRGSFVVVPAPQKDPKLRLGAGESYPGRTSSEAYADWVAALRQLGASWTLAFLPFSAYDQPAAADERTLQHEILKGAAQGVAVLAMLGNYPEELRTNVPELARRYEAAQQAAATDLRGLVSLWGVLHLDYAFFPGVYDDLAGQDNTPPKPLEEHLKQPLPEPTYPACLSRLQAAVKAADPNARFVAGMSDSSLEQWTKRGGLTWPQGVGLFSEALFHEPRRGGMRACATDLAQRAAQAGILEELWLKVYERCLESEGWSPGRQYAEGLVQALTEAASAAPQAHLLYATHPLRQEPENLVNGNGNATQAGIAFAICAHLLTGAEAAGEVQRADCRGYLFRRGDETLAALWPQPIGARVTIPFKAVGPVQHFGATQQYPDVPAGTTEVVLRDGANLLVGRFGL
jgi:hypothetical protein